MKPVDLKELIMRSPQSVLGFLDDVAQKETTIRMLWNLASDKRESKIVRKSAKKALYIARSKGVDTDRFKPDIEVIEEEKTENTIHSALLSLPDSHGKNLLLISIINTKTLSLGIYQFIISSEYGMQDYKVMQMSKKSLERFVDQNRDFFPVPSKYALFRLNKAFKISDEKKVLKRKKVPEILYIGNDNEITHPVLELISKNISHILTPTEEKELFKMRELMRISLPKDKVEEYKKEIESAKKSRLILGNRSPQERAMDIIDKFCFTYFTKEKRDIYREILLDIALYYYYRELQEYSRILIDYANRLIDMNIDIREHPLIQFLVYKEFLVE